eukprot:2686795-Rhodomonas_salina.3
MTNRVEGSCTILVLPPEILPVLRLKRLVQHHDFFPPISLCPSAGDVKKGVGAEEDFLGNLSEFLAGAVAVGT